MQRHGCGAMRGLFVGLALLCLAAIKSAAQDAGKYEPTVESLDQHPLPQWYAEAKLGIFIHWGLYSVPGWAPLSHPEHDFTNEDYIKNNPYAEWYLNVMRIPGSPTQEYHSEQYGANFDYYNFAPIFDREIEEVESRRVGEDLSRRRGAVCGADDASTTRASHCGRARR